MSSKTSLLRLTVVASACLVEIVEFSGHFDLVRGYAYWYVNRAAVWKYYDRIYQT